jgi:hypothetical protein
VAQALGILRGDQRAEEIGEGLTELKVRVKPPAVEHRVRMKDFRRLAGKPGKDASRVHEEEEADSVGKRGGAGAVKVALVSQLAEDVETLPAICDFDERLPSPFYLLLPNDSPTEAFIESP